MNNFKDDNFFLAEPKIKKESIILAKDINKLSFVKNKYQDLFDT